MAAFAIGFIAPIIASIFALIAGAIGMLAGDIVSGLLVCVVMYLGVLIGAINVDIQTGSDEQFGYYSLGVLLHMALATLVKLPVSGLKLSDIFVYAAMTAALVHTYILQNRQSDSTGTLSAAHEASRESESLRRREEYLKSRGSEVTANEAE